jgi:dienelactone hydrolase
MPATLERFVSDTTSIPTDVYVPKTTGRHPGVLVLHGTAGLMPEFRADILSFGEALAERNIVAAIPHYFERTGTAEGLDAVGASDADVMKWRETCGEALTFLRDHACVNAGRLGVVGFSLGGHLALTLGMSTPRGTSLKAVVDFFGPTRQPPLAGNRGALPPLLIHHGTSDQVVPIQDSLTLESELKAAGKIEGVGYRFVKYPGQGHRFTGPDLVAARKATVDFFDATL